MYQVNQKFDHERCGKTYTIKGAWSGARPGKSHCFLMCDDFNGHAYAGKVTPVDNVMDINHAEFNDMCGGHPEWFTLQNPPKSKSASVSIASIYCWLEKIEYDLGNVERLMHRYLKDEGIIEARRKERQELESHNRRFEYMLLGPFLRLNGKKTG